MDLKAPYVVQNDRNHRFSGCLLHCFCPNVFTFRVIRQNIHCFTNTRMRFVENRLKLSKGVLKIHPYVINFDHLLLFLGPL